MLDMLHNTANSNICQVFVPNNETKNAAKCNKMITKCYKTYAKCFKIQEK
jgi:hypothetical protein